MRRSLPAEESERLDRQALRIWEEQLGAEHPSVLDTMGTLADSYNRGGKGVDARKLCEEALALSRARGNPCAAPKFF